MSKLHTDEKWEELRREAREEHRGKRRCGIYRCGDRTCGGLDCADCRGEVAAWDFVRREEEEE